MDYVIQNKIKSRLANLKRNGVHFISGTVAPADSDVETNDIESMDKALDYFAEKGVQNLVAEPKWMGSRCQLYLHRNAAEDYAVTRNGYRIKIDMSSVFAKWRSLLDNDYFRGPSSGKPTRIILDGELMPWTAIGAGLVEREFFGFMKCYEAQSEFLKANGFTTALTKGIEGLYKEYVEDAKVLDKKAIQAKYPMYETFSNMAELVDQHFNDYDDEAAMESFSKQLELYAAEGPLEYKAFEILRVDFANGTYDRRANSVKARYDLLCDDYPDHEIAMVFNPASPEGRQRVKKYFATLVAKGYEGIMLKPDSADTEAVNCMKVRNKEYLRIIYGYDYDRPEKLKHLVTKKRTGRKRKLSHSEYKLGLQMLALDPKAVDYDESYDRIVKELLFDIEEEATLDSRL